MNRKFDPGFNRVVQWDIPLLDGYSYEWVKNTAKVSGSHHFNGIQNPGIIQQIKNYQPDSILVFGWSFQSHLKCLRYFHGKIPVFFRGDSTAFNIKPGFRKTLRKIFLKWVYKHVDYALYVGTKNKEYYIQNGLKEHQLVKAFHAVDNDRFMNPDKQYTEAADNWKKELNIASNELVILFAGKLEPIKNPSFFIKLATLCKELPVKFIVVGNGPLENEIKEMAKGLSSLVFIDFQNQQQMPVVYRLADALLMCSISETWGLAANEAMASGSIVMLADTTGGAVDLVEEERNGIIYSLANPDRCVAFIRSLIEHPEKTEKMKAASRRIIQHFNFEQIAIAIECLMV